MGQNESLILVIQEHILGKILGWGCYLMILVNLKSN